MSDPIFSNPNNSDSNPLNRRNFIKSVSAIGLASATGNQFAHAAPDTSKADETAVKGLYESLTDAQRKEICFDWDHKDASRGLLRTFVSNNHEKLITNFTKTTHYK